MAIKISLVAFMFGTYPVLPLIAQSELTTANLVRSGDKFSMECLSYMDAGQRGDVQVWDFSNVEPEDHQYDVSFFGDSIITGLEHGTLNRYTLHDDTLFLNGYENPLNVMVYEQPLSLLHFPMTLNDTLSCQFFGRGYYSDNYRTETCGCYFVEADATGTLILTEEDTLHNVLRLHSIRTASLSMNHDTTIVNNDIRQEIEERFIWYAPGYRYPVFVSLSRANYCNMQPVSDFQTSFRFLPEQQRLLPDSINEEIARRSQTDREETQQVETYRQCQSPLASHRVSVSGNTANVDYELNGPAHVTILVTDIMGMLHGRQEQYCESTGSYHAEVGLTGLRRGDYILYMNVNGKVTSSKINI